MLQTPSLVCLTFCFTVTNADVLNLEETIIEATPSSLCRDAAALKHPANSVADLVKMRHEQLRTGWDEGWDKWQVRHAALKRKMSPTLLRD